MPFSTDEKDYIILWTKGGDTVRLFGNVRDVMYELQHDPKWWNTHVVGTGEPNWARELLDKLQIYKNEEEAEYPMKQAFTAEYCELAHYSMVLHFERILQNAPCKPKFGDCLFFDNKLGN